MYAQMDNLWELIGKVTSFINNLPYVVVIMDSTLTVTYFLLIIKMFGNVSSSIQQCVSFINIYNSQKIKYDSFTKMWDDKTFNCEEIINLAVPNKLIIDEISIPINKTNLVGKNITITQGDQIVIRGASGTRR